MTLSCSTFQFSGCVILCLCDGGANLLSLFSVNKTSAESFDQTDEAEVDEITSGVLAEIGIEFESKLPQAKAGRMPTISQAEQAPLKTGDQATDALLAELGI